MSAFKAMIPTALVFGFYVFVYFGGRFLACSHSEDYGGGAGYRIAAGENTLAAGHTAVFLNSNSAALVGVESLCGVVNKGIRGSAYSHYDAIDR